MAEKGAQGSDTPLPTAAEKQLLRRRQELDYWKKNAARLRSRNLRTGLAIGAFVVGICQMYLGQYVEITHQRYSLLLETYTITYAGKTVFLTLNIDISTVAEQIQTGDQQASRAERK